LSHREHELKDRTHFQHLRQFLFENVGSYDELETLLDEVRVNGRRVRALRLDTDDTRSWPTLRSWGVLTLPALIFFRGGGRVGMLQGLRPLAELERVLTGWYGGRDAT